MIPSTNTVLNTSFEFAELPTNTYKINIGKNMISGQTDKLSAMEQAIYLLLNIERYRYLIYSWNYGVELEDLFGKPISYVLPEIKRRITEALLQDSRILAVYDFSFRQEKNKVAAAFKVHTIYGDISAEKEVNI